MSSETNQRVDNVAKGEDPTAEIEDHHSVEGTKSREDDGAVSPEHNSDIVISSKVTDSDMTHTGTTERRYPARERRRPTRYFGYATWGDTQDRTPK